MSQPELSFDPLSHTYYAGGQVVPGVTTVLQVISDFRGIPEWRLARASRRGIAVHAAVDLFNQGILDEASLDDEIVPRLESYKRFLAETGFEVRTSEQRVFDRNRWYAGTLDLTGVWQDTTWVVDLKTGLVPKSTGPQLAAYQHALEEPPRRRLCVQLSDDGYKLHYYFDEMDLSVFHSCLNIWNFKHAK